jgi:hypothetical protein
MILTLFLGMFLFARIILDNLEQMSSMQEIRNELRALPVDLNDAYDPKPHMM